MSKQSEAKDAQGYVDKGPTCGGCENLKFEMVPVPWMAKENKRLEAEGHPARYNLANFSVERNLRCALGGFAVKKTACCKLWQGKAK